MNTMKEKTAALMKSKEAEEEEPEAEPEPSEEILLLREIRDSLAAKNQ